MKIMLLVFNFKYYQIELLSVESLIFIFFQCLKIVKQGFFINDKIKVYDCESFFFLV